MLRGISMNSFLMLLLFPCIYLNNSIKFKVEPKGQLILKPKHKDFGVEYGKAKNNYLSKSSIFLKGVNSFYI